MIPAHRKPAIEPGTTSFSWVDWGAGIYSGWELLDYAAIALAESAPLLLIPGRRCENGKPVPVDRPDWVAVHSGAGRSRKSRLQSVAIAEPEAVAEVTNQIAEACLHCHEVYRDKPGGTTADPSNKAARCVPEDRPRGFVGRTHTAPSTAFDFAIQFSYNVAH